MPNGPVERTQYGPKCALCGERDPDAVHLAKHDFSICVGKFREPLKKSRKTDMIIHLARHRVHSEHAAALADQWRFPLNKKFFSCGLCIKIFSSIAERSNHIDNEHWRQGHNMDGWELSTLIRGLLLEQKVQAAWFILLSSHPNVVESNLRWELPKAEGLQLRLEKGHEPPHVLAKAALELSNHEPMWPSEELLMGQMEKERIVWGPSPAGPRTPVAATVVPSSTSTYQATAYDTQPRAPVSRLLPRSTSSSNVESSSIGYQISQSDPPPSSANVDDPFESHDFGMDAFAQPGPLMDLDIGDLDVDSGTISSQLSTYPFPIEWPSRSTNEVLNDSTRIRGNLVESGASLVAQMSHPRRRQPAAYEMIDGQGQISDSRNDVSASSTTQLPMSNFFHGSKAQLSNHENGFNYRNKPLPPEPPSDLPDNTNQRAENRPENLMDFTTG